MFDEKGSEVAAPLGRRRVRALPPRLNLALQGGGAHGAFTWGVLDALLQEPSMCFDGLSGSSAGALNAVALADGWMKGGSAGARQGLEDLWMAIRRLMPWGTVQGQGQNIRLSPASKMLAGWAGQFSPAQLNPFDLNPLRGLLTRQIDFEGLRKHSPFKLFVGTTQANTGKLRVFREDELTVDVMLASACLPRIHRPVLIDGEAYWDGGYCANPAIAPLFYHCTSRDVLLVLLSPLKHESTPRTVQEINARIAELAFSASFMREMQGFVQAAGFAGELLGARGRLERRLHQLRFHMIDCSAVPLLQRTDTKLLAHGPFLDLLREQGGQCARNWLTAHAGSIGRCATVDVRKWFD